MNKKIDWSGKLSESQTSWVDPKTNKTIMTPADSDMMDTPPIQSY